MPYGKKKKGMKSMRIREVAVDLKPAPDVSWYCYWEGGAWFEQV
jgi:hypothetical protein